jgi:hypothetical protein
VDAKIAGGPVGSEGGRVDESSIRTGNTYWIVVIDLERQRPIWVGGQDRSEGSRDACYCVLD